MASGISNVQERMTADLSGRVALITGAGGAIGSEIARVLARNGADIVINEIDEPAGRRIEREIVSMGRRALLAVADVGDRRQTEEMAAQVSEVFGGIDILVNNAGINVGPSERKPIGQFSVERWHDIIRTDLDGVFYASRPFIDMMAERKYGRIVNIGSIVGLVPLRLQSAFAAAKAGVINLTRAMALELAPHGILVNAVAPGSILSEGTKRLFYSDQQKSQELLAHIPLGRPGTPAEIAYPVLFLVSQGSAYMTGSVVVVDGGWTSGYARSF
jgi:NAD(P)-dependent dehydrogenase (short-subunit alcohol dehydrogenase family)